MSESKFDLNKALQAAKLYTKIDYGNLNIPDMQQTMDNFENWRKSQGYKTEEEKLEDLKSKTQAAQQKFNELGLWNSEDPYEVYNTYQTDPEKQAEFKRNGEMVAGIGSTIATLPFTAGTLGWIPAITTTATGAAGGYAGAYSGQQLGQYFDNKYETNTTPWLSTIGGLAGGILGGGLGHKGWKEVTNQYLINKAFKSGQLKYGQPTTYTAYHQSSTPITKFKFPFKERWDVRTHGADPNGAFFTVGEPAAAGFLAERPYTGQFHVKVQKPLIQTGELSGPTKNSLRNAIVRRARKNGADAVFFDGIADNQLQNQKILFATDKADIKHNFTHPLRSVSVDLSRSTYPGFPSSATIEVFDDAGTLIGRATAGEKDGYLIPEFMNNLSNGQAKHVSFDMYDGMIDAAKRLGLKGVRSGDKLMSPHKTKRIWDYYKQSGFAQNLDNSGFDIYNGPNQPRIVLDTPILGSGRITYK